MQQIIHPRRRCDRPPRPRRSVLKVRSRILKRGLSLATGATLALTGAILARAQAHLPVYTDALVNGFEDWSWAPRNLTNTSTVHSGAASIRVSASAWQALAFHHPAFDSSPYASFNFWANGGPNGGQVLQVQAVLNGIAQRAYQLPALKPNNWQQFTIPLGSLGADNQTNLERLWLQLTSAGGASTFYVDDVQLIAKPAPARVSLSLDATQPVRPVDPRWFGVNAAIWDGYFDQPETVALLQAMGTLVLRFPGGSLSDQYHWAPNKTDDNTWTWATSFDHFAHVATNIGAQAIITANYGTGTATEAADWVRYSNQTKHYGFRFWEIGNECYGTWEIDQNSLPHDPYTYAVRAADYLQQMKAVDPTIKVGIVAVPGETNSANGYTAHSAYNPRTGQTVYGWTPVVLATLKGLGVTPDFLIHHRYPEYTRQESDPLLLQSSVAWAKEAADLRQQITDYFGAGGTAIELLCTENNSNAGKQGRQSTSLVNGLYLLDSAGQLMLTEFNSFVWWDLRNGRDYSGDMDPSIYGWRSYGDLGMIDGLSSPYPTFYAAKLRRQFARPGDTVLRVASDYLLLASYAIRRENGALNLLVINKDSSASFSAQINLAGFVPHPVATQYSYGIPQDNAAQTGVGSTDIAQSSVAIAGPTFDYVFPPYSATLFSFAPAAPRLALLPPGASPGAGNLQLLGQVGARYALQSSTNLVDWTTVSAFTLTDSTLTLTNAFAPDAAMRFWRAVWPP